MRESLACALQSRRHSMPKKLLIAIVALCVLWYAGSHHNDQKSPKAVEEAYIRVTTEKGYWATIYVENLASRSMVKQEIPNGRFQVPPGQYKVWLRNTMEGTKADCGAVTLEPFQVIALHADMEEGKCQLL